MLQNKAIQLQNWLNLTIKIQNCVKTFLLSSEYRPQNVPLLTPKMQYRRKISASHSPNLSGMFYTTLYINQTEEIPCFYSAAASLPINQPPYPFLSHFCPIETGHRPHFFASSLPYYPKSNLFLLSHIILKFVPVSVPKYIGELFPLS